MVTRIDRLGPVDQGPSEDIVHALRDADVTLKATGQPIDTSTADGKAVLDMLGVFAGFGDHLCRERQRQGIAQAKTKGIYTGRLGH